MKIQKGDKNFILQLGGCMIILIVGPSGVGKNEITKRLRAKLSPNTTSVSATTRPMRGNDVEGQTYHFLTEEAFEVMVQQNCFLEHKEFNGKRYGTPVKSVEHTLNTDTFLFIEIEVQGALMLKQLAAKQCWNIFDMFIEPPSPEELERRLKGRGTETHDEIEKRLGIAQWELTQAFQFGHRFVNGDLDECVERILDTLVQEYSFQEES